MPPTARALLSLLLNDGKLSIDHHAGDTDIHVLDFIKHILTSSDAQNIEDQIFAFDQFFEEFLSDQKSLSFINQWSRDIGRELKTDHMDLSVITSILSSLKKKSISAKPILSGLESI